MVTSTTKAISTGIILFILLTIIIYVIVMFELYKNRLSIFAQYVPPPPPSNHFFPQGTVTPLSQEEIESRNAIILASIGAAP